MTPPRTANVPASSTTGVRVHPPATSSAVTASRSMVSPTEIVMPRARSSAAGRVLRIRASAEVTTTRGLSIGLASRYSVAMRSTRLARSGDMSAYGETSIAGSAATSSPSPRQNRTSSSIRRAASSSGATTTTSS